MIGFVGAGAMGEVFSARDVRLNRDVALKVLPERFATDSDRRTRFEREARILASFNHPRARRSLRRAFATDDAVVYFTLNEHESDVWMLELTRNAWN
jgi:serine/threonine protein kinase